VISGRSLRGGDHPQSIEATAKLLRLWALAAKNAQAEEAARIVPVYAVGSLEHAEQQRRLAEGKE
jgi:hypothetical protein